MPKAKVWTEIYYEQCIPKHWDFFPDSRASLDYFAENLSFLYAFQLTISNSLKSLTNIFSVVSLLH